MENEYQIQALIETKSFEQLTDAEKTLVLAYMGEDEYVCQYKAVESMRLFLTDDVVALKPNVSTKANAIAALRARKERVGLIAAIVNVRVPAYAVAAMLLLLLSVSWFYHGWNPQVFVSVSKPLPAPVIYKTDTLRIEKDAPKYVEAPVSKHSKPIKTDKAITVSTNANSTVSIEMPAIQPITFSTKQVEEQMKNVGEVNTQQQVLNRFLVSAK